MGAETGPEAVGPASLVGRVIGGYQLERVLGAGVTGVALLGRLIGAADQLAAIRILMLPLQTPAAVRAEFRQALARQAQALFALRHPHILRVYAFGEDVVTDFPYIAQPYMPGGSLAARLTADPFPLTDVANQLAALADALDSAHSHGILHGDIKPANVLYDAHDQAQLADFGIARLFESVYGPAAAAGLARGSAAYIAPEQALGEEVSVAADLYSLGVVLYQMVAGRVPFEGVSPAAVTLKHVQQPPPAPRRFRPELPEAAESVILRALAKEPSARYPTAGALAEAFARALGGTAEDGGETPSRELRADEAPVEEAAPPAPAGQGMGPLAVGLLGAPEPAGGMAPPTGLPFAVADHAPPAARPLDRPGVAGAPFASPIAQQVDDAADDDAVDEVDGVVDDAAEPTTHGRVDEEEEPRDEPASSSLAMQAVPAPAPTAPAPITPAPIALLGSNASPADPATPGDAAPEPSPPASAAKAWLTPALARSVMLAIFFGALALVAIPLVRVVGIPQALLMAVVLALLVCIVIAVPARPDGGPTADDTRTAP